MKKLWYVCMLLTVCLVGCNKTDDLWDDVNDLKTRVTALEKTVQDLNWNIEAVRELCKEGATITDIELKDGIYTITLSNGKTLKLVEETGAGALIPQMGIDNDGYWTVSYDNGSTFTQLKDKSGNPIKATAENGKTPLFQIDAATGYWQVSYDGSTYENVKDSAGNPVKATDGEAVKDKFFNSVEKVGNNFNIELRDGTKLSIPIISNFYCKFDESIVGIQRIAAGSTKDFIVHMKGVESYIITAPEGWEATLSEPSADNDEGTLTIKAPATAKTLSRAVADNTKDVSILATSGAYAAIAKIQVELGEAETRIDYKAKFDNGESITIGDITFDKNTYPDAEVVELDGTEPELDSYINNSKKVKILFLTGNNDFTTINPVNLNNTIIIIGKYSDSKPVIKPSRVWKTVSGNIFIKNIHLDMSSFTTDGQYFNNSNTSSATDFTALIIDECKISDVKNPIYQDTAKDNLNGINTIIINRTRIMVNADNKALIHLYTTKNLAPYKKFAFTNNIVYSKTPYVGQILNWGLQTDFTEGNLTAIISNNTVINIAGNNPYFRHNKGSLTMTKNIFYVDSSFAKNSNLYTYVGNDTHPVSVTTVDVKDNIVYGLTSNSKWYNYHSNCDASAKVDPYVLTPHATAPMTITDVENGIFVLATDMDGYGANIE